MIGDLARIVAFLRSRAAQEEREAKRGVNVDHCLGAAEALADAADAIERGEYAGKEGR